MIQIKLTKCFFYTNKAHEIVTIISILVQEKVSIILSFKLLKKKTLSVYRSCLDSKITMVLGDLLHKARTARRLFWFKHS